MFQSSVIINFPVCDNRCLFCNTIAKQRRGALTVERLKKVEKDLLLQVLDLKKRGLNESVSISGCDPIQYPGIAPFIKYIKRDLNFTSVTLLTHGRNLRDVKLVKELKRAGLDKLKIPLYGSRAEIHDSVTQVKGSFRETLRGIKNVFSYAPGTGITITSLIMKQNYKDVLEIFRLANKYASKITFSVPCIANMDYAEKYMISFEKMKTYLKRLLDAAEKVDIPFQLTDVPFCVLGADHPKVINTIDIPVTSNTYSIPEIFRSSVPHTPNYRVKKHLPACRHCALVYKCDGFYDHYVRFFSDRSGKDRRFKRGGRYAARKSQ
jgi:MoaA/NifB/PqqE/SkfB family radical SAM enzyme